MSVFNLGVVFGPTLLRAAEETLAAILDIKFNNVVIEILIENYDLCFKNVPGKASDYLAHSNSTSPPEPVPRTYGAYRTTRNAINNTQPVMRVVTRANYTDTVMSSSLQNIPNGVHQNTNKTVKSVHPIYETKSHLNQLNQSTPSLTRDVSQLIAPTRDMSIGRESITSQPVYMSTTMSSSPNTNHTNSHSPIHRSGNSSLSGVHMDHSISPLQSNHVGIMWVAIKISALHDCMMCLFPAKTPGQLSKPNKEHRTAGIARNIATDISAVLCFSLHSLYCPDLG